VPRSKDEGGLDTNRGSGFWLQQSIIKEIRKKGVASMANFPRSSIGGLSVSRMIIGTNWFLGYCHDTKAKEEFITRHVTNRESIAAIIEVFLRAGVDTIMTPWQRNPQFDILHDAIASAEDRAGVKAIKIGTPSFPVTPATVAEGWDLGEVERILDQQLSLGTSICMPHTETTDAMVDIPSRSLRRLDEICRLIRERGMIPGLSTHMPEAIVYADETGLDVETYIALYNAAGYLMHLEVDWTARLIWRARKPVITIKPLAAGQIRAFQGLAFVWSTIRAQDLVTVGTSSPEEAAECIELSLGILERRLAEIELQKTRSKASVI